MQKVRYTESYIDRLFTQRDSLGFHGVIQTAEIDKASQACWTFNRALEWLGSSRSGVWQYYEGTDLAEQERLLTAFVKFELNEIAKWYSFGMKHWESDQEISKLDDWMTKNWFKIEQRLFQIIANELDNIKELAK